MRADSVLVLHLQPCLMEIGTRMYGSVTGGGCFPTRYTNDLIKSLQNTLFNILAS